LTLEYIYCLCVQLCGFVCLLLVPRDSGQSSERFSVARALRSQILSYLQRLAIVPLCLDQITAMRSNTAKVVIRVSLWDSGLGL
jgi:hypothetical protein